MFNAEMVRKVVEMAAKMNMAIFPWSFIVPALLAIIAVGLVVHANRSPGVRSSRFLKVFVGIVYFCAGLPILGMAGDDLGFALTGAIALCLIGVLFFIDTRYRANTFVLSERKDLRFISLLLMATGIFFYPLIEIAAGFHWPGIVFFGQECPTTIFVIGLMIGSLPRVNRLIFLVLAINACITGFSVGIAGATFDYSYGISGVIGLVMAVKYRREFLFRNRSRERQIAAESR